MRRILPVLGLILPLLLLANCGGGGSTADGGGGGASDLYKTMVYTEAQVTRRYTDLVFSHRPNEGGLQYTSELRAPTEIGTDQLTLLLDLWVPPNASAAAPVPLVIWVHGGGFVAGGKEERAGDAMGYARAGYAAASINYRLTPGTNETLDGAKRLKAIEQAADDLMNAVRYLKVNAALYNIDATRIAVIGTSAGGALSLVNAVQFDDLDNTLSDYPGTSAQVAAAVSTGATLIDPLFDSDLVLQYDRSDTPVLLFHTNLIDSATGATWDDNVLPTKTRIDNSGNTCTAIPTPGAEHTVPLEMDGKWWPTTGPFLWEHLRLASL
ncbi:MAG: alpha/beta hydrolase [Vitreoscilla sp.]|nr:alpha/beta hydrolase [Vitreoscilla sp.]